MFAWFAADSGTFDCQAQFSVKTSLSEFSRFCRQESGDDISIDFQEPINSVERVLASGRSHSSCFVLLCVCVCFLFRVARAGRAASASNG